MNDKAAHAMEYAGLGALTLRALARGKLAGVRRGVVIGALLVAVFYGLSDEAHQYFVPGRDCDLRDVAADAFGAGVAVGAIWAWGIIRRFFAFHDDPV
jgi:VanZ family protein